MLASSISAAPLARPSVAQGGGSRSPTVRVVAAVPSATALSGARSAPRGASAGFLRTSTRGGVGAVRGASLVAHAKKKKKKDPEPAPVDEEEDDEEVEVEVEEVIEEVYEEEEDVIVDRPMQSVLTTVQTVAPGLWDKPVVRNSVYTVGAVLAGTFLYSVVQVVKKYTSKRSKRKRTVGKNMMVIEALNEYLPAARAKLDKGAVGTIRRVTGFKNEVIFRKYLRYLLDQRIFDQDAVADVVQLKNSCALSDETVVEMLEDSAERTFKRTGILMRKPSGMTASGLQKKATGRALFAKLMYLADQDALLPGAEGEKLQLKMKEIFGATEEDALELRIVSLSEADTDRLEALMGRGLEGGTPTDADEADDEETPDDFVDSEADSPGEKTEGSGQ